MNRAIRPRPTDPRAAPLAALLPPLQARVWAEEVLELSALIQGLAQADAARALVRAADEARARRAAVLSRARALRGAMTGLEGGALATVLERHLRQTVHDPLELRADLAALNRDLDLAALLEREAGRTEREGVLLELIALALGGMVAGPEGGPGPEVPLTQRAEAFNSSGAAGLLGDLATHEERAPTRRAATRALARALGTLLAAELIVEAEGVRVLHGLLRDPQEDPWVRRSALLAASGLESAIARRWLAEAREASGGREPFLLRAQGVALTLARPEAWAVPDALAAAQDPSELVRATLVDGLIERWGRGGDLAAGHALQEALSRLLCEDPEPRIRARIAAKIGAAGPEALVLLPLALNQPVLVAGFALESAETAAREGWILPPALREALQACRRSPIPALARGAARALAAVKRQDLPATVLADALVDLGPGEHRDLDLPENITPLDLAAALTVPAGHGFGFWVQPRGPRAVRVTRGEPAGFALWRLLHELRRPSPSKRQGWSHMVARADRGAIRVPPRGLAEESATGVPGQRVLSEREAGWAPEVPLPDDYLHAAQRGQVWVVSAAGVTEVVAPARRLARLAAAWRLSWSFARLDELRRADLDEGRLGLPQGETMGEGGRYLPALRGLGFQTRHRAGLGGLALPGLSALSGRAPRLAPYAANLGANSLLHLALALALIATLLFGRVALVRRQLRAARAALPLVMGGWGTRGKSGTERCKAGLMEGLGLPVFAKTTGCEAMFLHAPPGGHASEIFLFRPYEKATIWEQTDVTRLAAKMGARVLLWECMGLNPLYVDMLQQRWMQDDLSTLTNAYPDHEDIQGPTGLDVARVIARFCPPESLLITTEDNMLPELKRRAAERKTPLRQVSRVHRELLPRDLLARLPYLEHAGNVALAAAVGEALGVPKVEAIGLIAEHVVPDLGALIVYPAAWHMQRQVSFANAMSANDRLSFLHSWRRVGFAELDHAADPHRWIVSVVNNRADRVARSRIFAEILAEDASAHRHVLIGTNVAGLHGYLREAVRARLVAAAGADDPRAATLALFAHLRLVEPGALGAACGARLGAPEAALAAWRGAVAAATPPTEPSLAAARQAAKPAEEAARALGAACAGGAALAEALLDALARRLALAAAAEAPIPAVQALYEELVSASVILIQDPYATGDQILAAAAGAAPPGAEVTLIGVQNIKGTGLSFAYLWVHWRELHRLLGDLGREGASALVQAARRKALDALNDHPLDSLLAAEALLSALDRASGDVEVAARAPALRVRAQAAASALSASRGQLGQAQTGLRDRLIRLLEKALDPLDAVWRRYRASQILDDLAKQRISHPSAQAQLQALMARHKGGWLG